MQVKGAAAAPEIGAPRRIRTFDLELPARTAICAVCPDNSGVMAAHDSGCAPRLLYFTAGRSRPLKYQGGGFMAPEAVGHLWHW